MLQPLLEFGICRIAAALAMTYSPAQTCQLALLLSCQANASRKQSLRWRNYRPHCPSIQPIPELILCVCPPLIFTNVLGGDLRAEAVHRTQSAAEGQHLALEQCSWPLLRRSQPIVIPTLAIFRSIALPRSAIASRDGIQQSDKSYRDVSFPLTKLGVSNQVTLVLVSWSPLPGLALQMIVDLSLTEKIDRSWLSPGSAEDFR